jgi:hypothetical protein
MGTDINHSKLIGGKKKNGHKLDCVCHICENMKNKAKRGGYQEDAEKEKEKMMGGSKKKNGHKKDCNCPICKNMKNSIKRVGKKVSRRTRKIRGGDDSIEDKVENDTDDTTDNDTTDNDTTDNDTTDNSTLEQTKDVEQSLEVKKEDKKVGGKKKKNGHKVNCQCPICKNMYKKKGGDSDTVNQTGNIEEAGVSTSSAQELKSNETSASTSDYDELDAAERGQVSENVGGRTSRKHKRGKKRSRKTRKNYKRH